jgi:MtfA peptidase
MIAFYLFIVLFLFIKIISIRNNNIKTNISIPPLFFGQRKILEKYFIYYRELSETDRAEFDKRVQIILKNKLFIAKENFIVTNPMKILISGALVQLTFGMKQFLLPNYRTIHIYPDAFLNHQTNKLHRGETNTIGYISLSWKHFMEGYSKTSDRLNVGLHEMAHALLNTIIFSDLHDVNLDDKLILLDRIPETERKGLFEGSHPFFRDYAKKNIKEFFAVAIECFFETPEDFNNNFPEFYLLMCNLINQNPVKKQYRTCGLV